MPMAHLHPCVTIMPMAHWHPYITIYGHCTWYVYACHIPKWNIASKSLSLHITIYITNIERSSNLLTYEAILRLVFTVYKDTNIHSKQEECITRSACMTDTSPRVLYLYTYLYYVVSVHDRYITEGVILVHLSILCRQCTTNVILYHNN